MFPDNLRHQHAACARGQFNSYFRQFGQLMAQAGAARGRTDRLGGEHGRQPRLEHRQYRRHPSYISCFRRLATAMKQGGPNLKIEWSNAKKGKLKVNVLNTYPGDAYADLWGRALLRQRRRPRQRQGWAAFLDSTNDGGPQGIGQWLKQARAHGKKLAVPEWGVWDQGGGAERGRRPRLHPEHVPVFKADAGDIAYENY